MTESTLEQLKQSFISIISHELRTPVAIIKGYLSLMDKLVARGDSLQNLQKFLKEAQNGLNRLNNIVTELIQYCELERGAPLEIVTEFNVNDLWPQIAPLVQEKLDEKKIEFCVMHAPDLGQFRGNETRLREMLYYLVENALKFTSEKGNIVVRFWKEDEELKIQVEDTGVGIKKEEVSHIFEPFYQIEPYLTRTKGGLGLGLSIVKHIVEDHGGRIEVESKEGKGSKFTITLPYGYQTAKEKLVLLSKDMGMIEKQSVIYAAELTDLYEEKRTNKKKIDDLYRQLELYAKDISMLYQNRSSGNVLPDIPEEN